MGNNINYLAARLRQIYSKPAARFICMVKTHCGNLAVGLRQSSSKLAARSPLALPQGLFFGKGYVPKLRHIENDVATYDRAWRPMQSYPLYTGCINGHLSASSQLLRFILSLRLYSSFITSRPGAVHALIDG